VCAASNVAIIASTSTNSLPARAVATTTFIILPKSPPHEL